MCVRYLDSAVLMSLRVDSIIVEPKSDESRYNEVSAKIAGAVNISNNKFETRK